MLEHQTFGKSPSNKNCIIDTNIINKNPMVNDTVIAPRNAVNRMLLNLYSVDTTEDNAQINHTNSKNLQI